MKNIFKKVKSTDEQPKLERITTNTLEDYRKEVIDRGKRFKYPIQYERHKIVRNALVISLILLLLLTIGTAWSLYRGNQDGVVFYKLTQVIPLPVASVDGSLARYSDYLAQYRSSIHYFVTKEASNSDIEALAETKKQFKIQALDNAIEIGYARKLAAQKGITVTDDEINQDFKAKRTYDGEEKSIDTYSAIMEDYYGLTSSEYRQVLITNPLLLKKVSLAIDKKAQDLVNELKLKLAPDGSNFVEIAETYRDSIEFLDSGAVKHNNSDGGRAKTAVRLAINQVSEPFVTNGADGYYFVKLIFKDDKNVHYQSIRVPLTEFKNQLEQLKAANKIKKFINIE